MAVSDVRLTILGSGTSAGIPVIGCDCPVCRSDDPRDRRLRTSAAVQFVDSDGKERTVLIDASPDLRAQALRHGLVRCDGIVFTHNHVDHTFGLDEVRRFNALMKRPIDIYAEGRTLEHLFRVYKHIFDRQNNVNDSFVATLIAHEIDAETSFDIHGLRVTPVRFLHGKLPILGFRFEDAAGEDADGGPLPLAYCTDVSGVPPESWGKLTGLRTLVLDMLRYRKHPTHFTVDEAVAAAEKIGADRTWFIHMTHDICHAALEGELPGGMGLAFDGLVIGGRG